MAFSKDAKTAKDGRLIKPINYLESCIAISAKTLKESDPETAKLEDPVLSVDEQIQKAIVDNPKMNAATFYNLLKSLGITFNKGELKPDETSVETEEADSTSTASQVTRESSPLKTGNLNFRTRSLKFVESADKPKDQTIGFTKFGSILIKEGPGNFGSQYYYSKKALQSAVAVFEGKKAYADHPSETDEVNRPERSVRDIFGYFTNVKYQETDGRGELYAELQVMPTKSFDWARDLMTAAVNYSEQYPDKDFVGLSINASGDAQPVSVDVLLESATNDEIKAKLLKAKESGITEMNNVDQFDDAVSCDLVTEAGAGGRIKELMEGNKNMTKEEMKAKADAESKAKKEADEKAVVEAKEKEAGSAVPTDAETDPAGDEAGTDGQHDDAAQDIDLIKKMISKHMGDDKTESSPEECGMVKEAYEACKEMGCKEDEAAEKAVHMLKLSKHMASKKEASAKEADEASAKEAADKAADEGKDAADKKDAVKESNRNQLITLQAENAALKAKLGQYDIQKQIEKVCKESGLKTEVTKKFREAVAGAKSVTEVSNTWKIWKSAYDAQASQVEVHDFMESINNSEKQFTTNSAADFVDSLKS